MKKTVDRYQLQQFFYVSPDMMCIANFQGYFKHVNPAFSAILGYSEKELLSVPYLEFVHPEDRDITVSEATNTAGGLPALIFENRYLAKSGQTIWLSWRSITIGDEIFAIARDITLQKQETQKNLMNQLSLRFQQSFDGIGVGLAHIGMNSEIIQVNDEFCNLFGSPKEDRQDRNCASVLRAEDIGFSEEFKSQVLSSVLSQDKIDI